MHSLSVIVGTTVWALLFRQEEAAEIAYLQITGHQPHDPGDRIVLTDDFGQQVWLRRNSVHGVMLEDLSLSRVGYIERMLHNARMQAEAQQKAAHDSTIRHAQAGPAVLAPGRFNR